MGGRRHLWNAKTKRKNDEHEKIDWLLSSSLNKKQQLIHIDRTRNNKKALAELLPACFIRDRITQGRIVPFDAICVFSSSVEQLAKHIFILRDSTLFHQGKLMDSYL